MLLLRYIAFLIHTAQPLPLHTSRLATERRRANKLAEGPPDAEPFGNRKLPPRMRNKNKNPK
jgi:hypothetical protein